jgi:LysM repeat protein
MRNHRTRWLGILSVAGVVLLTSPGTSTPASIFAAGETPPAMEPSDSTGDEAPPNGEMSPPAEQAAPEAEEEPTPDSQEEATPDSQEEAAPEAEEEATPDSQGEAAPEAQDEEPSASQEEPASPDESTVAPEESVESPAKSTAAPEKAVSNPKEPAQTPGQTQEPMEESAPAAPGYLAVPGPEQATPSHKYTVKKGDTLWDISNAYMKDSFLWPKLWKNNQYIINPDLIYPGNVINFPGEEALRQAEMAEKPVPMPPPQVVEPEAPVEEEAPVEAESPAEPEMQMPAPSQPNRFTGAALAESGYIITGEKSIGIVVGARDDRKLIGEFETAYLLPRGGTQSRVGDRYTIYRVSHKVYHPVSGKYMGDLIKILGLAEVTGANPHEKTVTAKILVSYDTIYEGDSLMPPQESVESIEGSPPSTSPGEALQGVIVDVKENRAAHAQHDVVYIDHGIRDGVRSGDRFAVIREGKRTSVFSFGGGVRLPQRTIGQLEVIAVQDTTATAQITQSTEVIRKGDRYETHGQP